MKEITVQLTEKQEYFLKMFAANHFPGSNQNLATCNPIHVVEENRYKVIPYSSDLEGLMDEDNLVFMDRGCECEFSSEVEFIKQYYEWKGKKFEGEIIPFKEADCKLRTKDDWLVTSWEEYFQYYGVEEYFMGWKEDDWQPVAFFFILEEAKRYIKYQGHNLKNPRTYTYSGGYSNEGEYNHFWRLLFSIGKQLNEGEEKRSVDNNDKQ